MATRTSTYESVLRGVSILAGVKMNRLLAEDASLLYEYINQRLRKGWEAAWWPEWTVIEERYYREGLWAAGTYADGAIVYYSPDEVYYENTSGGTTTETPSSTATDWEEAGNFEMYVPLVQTTSVGSTALTGIGYVKDIYDEDPGLNTLIGPIAKRITTKGVGPRSVVNPAATGTTGSILAAPTSIFIEFRERARDMSGMVEYDATSAYKVGDWVYYESATVDGEAYEVIVATTAGQTPEDTAASFSALEFPYILTEYVKTGALGDWLSAGGGGAELGDTASSVRLAAFNIAKAENALEEAIYNEFSQQTTYSTYKVRTG
jgi:hypothetical protein